jgi:hypothetical protein
MLDPPNVVSSLKESFCGHLTEILLRVHMCVTLRA